jgi:tRNA modification GTPase
VEHAAGSGGRSGGVIRPRQLKGSAMSRGSQTDTIFAQSTAPGKAGVAVVRVSGPAALCCVRTLTGRDLQPRQATLRTIRDPISGDVIDRGLALWFPGPASFTGEDVVEFHVHGGRAVLAGLLNALSQVSDMRLAEPGEFVRRAFLAGKMDLSETEALADLIDAETAAQRRQALLGLQGGLGIKAEEWRHHLVRAHALLEAEIDFPDEGDIPTGLIDQARCVIADLHRDLCNVLSAPSGERLREGAVVVITGSPNVGKSSFLNWAAKRDVAIVTPVAGTTRDVLEVALDLNGYPVTLVDTAGFRETDDPVEQEALRRARARIASADLVLAFSQPGDTGAEVASSSASVWPVVNKSDLLQQPLDAPRCISVLTGHGVQKLLDDLGTWLANHMKASETSLITRLRHRRALEDARDALASSLLATEPELIAEHIRQAAHSLARISGRVDVEDVLDALFGSFCIGK